jgi:hypothetical protein
MICEASKYGLKAYVQFGINLRTGLNKRLTDVDNAQKAGH